MARTKAKRTSWRTTIGEMLQIPDPAPEAALPPYRPRKGQARLVLELDRALLDELLRRASQRRGRLSDVVVEAVRGLQ